MTATTLDFDGKMASVEERTDKAKEKAAIISKMDMLSCVNHGRGPCIAPFCEYCAAFKPVRTVSDTIAHWKMCLQNTINSTLQFKEHGGEDAPQLFCKREAVCDLFERFLKEFEQAYAVEVAHREKEGSEK